MAAAISPSTVSGLGNVTFNTVDAQGNVYIGDNGSNVVRKVTPQGVASIVASALSSPLGLAFEVQNQSMAQHLRGHGAQVVARDVIPFVENGANLGSQDQRLGAAGRSTEADEFGRLASGGGVLGMSRQHDGDAVPADFVGNRNLPREP